MLATTTVKEKMTYINNTVNIIVVTVVERPRFR